MMYWHIVTSDVYKAGVKKDQDMYFLSDTHEIYRGEVPFTESVILYTELPTSGIAVNRLYINSTTLEGKIHNGTDWVQVIKPVSDTVTKDGVDPVSSKAVIAYVADEIKKVTGSGDVVTGIAWSDTDHVLTVTKGSTASETITFDGLGVTLNYTAANGKLQLADASGNLIGDAISLDLERFVHSGIYDAENKKIILYFDEAKKDSVEIPVGDLVDTYTAESTSSLDLTVTDNKFKGTVKISKENGNLITVKDDGLYVSVDITGKVDKVTDAVEGNIVLFGEGGAVKDSGKAFADLESNSKVYTGATLEEATTGATPKKDDVAIITTPIGDTGKNERKAYIHDGETWVALDESYNAENVYFANDLTTTSAIGNVTLTNGQGTIAAKGKNLKQVWDTIFVKEKNPTITQPSVSISAPQNKAYEVGTAVTPTFTATLNPGKYEFNDNNGATGITASTWEITDTAGHTAAANTGSFDAFTVEDGTSYKITAKATYEEASIVPVTNVKNPYTAGKIKAGNKSATSAAVTGYRKGFYGTVTAKPDAITSTIVRGLQKSTTAAPAKGNTWTISIPAGAMGVIFAYPATLSAPASVIDAATKYNVLSAFTEVDVDVEGANGYTAKTYKVYYTYFANATTSANTYTVTL